MPGHDVEDDDGSGWTLLRHAVDIEADSHDQGRALHVDVTAFLLARGADPARAQHAVGIAGGPVDGEIAVALEHTREFVGFLVEIGVAFFSRVDCRAGLVFTAMAPPPMNAGSRRTRPTTRGMR